MMSINGHHAFTGEEMKHLIFIIIIAGILHTETLYSFSKKNLIQQDSSKTKEFIDENKNGKDDRDETNNEKCHKGRRGDRFIDKDGDGINDEREDVIGPKRHHRGRRNGRNQ